jgi:Family of unknown function (DUF5994)
VAPLNPVARRAARAAVVVVRPARAVVAVGYRRDGWTDTPPQVDIAGHPVQLLGFTSDEPTSVIVIGHDGHHLTLRVIAPDTSDQAAREALAAIPERANDGTAGRKGTAAARSVADVAERLARHEGRADDQRTAEIMRWCEEAAAQFDEARIQTFGPSSSNTSFATGCTKPARPHDRRQTLIPASTAAALARTCCERAESCRQATRYGSDRRFGHPRQRSRDNVRLSTMRGSSERPT